MTEEKLIQEAIQKGIEKFVNGNIRELRQEMHVHDEEQNRDIKEIKEKVDELMAVFRDTSGFFRVAVKIAQFLILMGALIGVVLGGVRWLRG